jgi:hypothetical protein
MKKIIFAVAALSLSASAFAMPPQVPARYYEHRAFVVSVWDAHFPCIPHLTGSCDLMSVD